MKITLFENERVENLYPFSILHASWELFCGAYQSWERTSNIAESGLSFLGRDHIEQSFISRKLSKSTESADSNTLYLDGALIWGKKAYKLLKQYIEENVPTVLSLNNHIVGIYTDQVFSDRQSLLKYQPEDYRQIELDDEKFTLIEYLHQAIGINEALIKQDYEDFYSGNSESLYKADEVSIGQNVVLDTESGPIILEKGAKVDHGSVIYGPCYIGENSRIKTNAVIEPGCSFGPVCKIGGEVENSILLGYSNKQHMGFLGHSYLCEWVNIGANTDNSDLKNTYGEISLSIRGESIDTGEMFVGSMIGDHTKTAINTQLNTGTVIGIHSMIACQGFPPTDIRSYNWTGSKNRIIYKMNKAIDTARKVMDRRGKTLNESELKLMKNEYERVQEYYYKNGK